MLSDPSMSGRHSSASVSPRSVFRPNHADDAMPHKRIRVGRDGYSPVPSEPLPAPETHKASTAWQQPPQGIELPRIHERVLNRPWQPNP
jgi:hypothetical protein